MTGFETQIMCVGNWATTTALFDIFWASGSFLPLYIFVVKQMAGGVYTDLVMV